MNIQQYRAKKIDNDEWVEGYFVLSPLGNCVIHTNIEYGAVNGETLGGATSTITQVDPKTLAIHFPNMIDKNGTKIFASLSEDGVGGDEIITPCTEYFYTKKPNIHGQGGKTNTRKSIDTVVAIFTGSKIIYKHVNNSKHGFTTKECEVIGIHNE